MVIVHHARPICRRWIVVVVVIVVVIVMIVVVAIVIMVMVIVVIVVMVVPISIPGFCIFFEVNNNLMTSKALSRLPENYYQFCIYSDIIGPPSALHYSLPHSVILPFKNDQDSIWSTTSKSRNTGNAEY